MINLGPTDLALTISLALPAANASNTTGIMDLQNIAPNSDAWRLGLIRVDIPALPANSDATKTITLTLQAAPPLLGDPTPAIAPQTPDPGVFAAPQNGQIIAIPGVAMTGSLAQTAYFFIPLDTNGSAFQFIRVVQAVAAGGGDNTAATITYGFANA